MLNNFLTNQTNYFNNNNKNINVQILLILKHLLKKC